MSSLTMAYTALYTPQGRWQLASEHESSPQGYDLEIIEKALKTPSVKVGFACRQAQNRTTPLRTSRSQENENSSLPPSLHPRPDLAHQRVQAEQAGFRPHLVLADHGVSGIATRLRELPRVSEFE